MRTSFFFHVVKGARSVSGGDGMLTYSSTIADCYCYCYWLVRSKSVAAGSSRIGRGLNIFYFGSIFRFYPGEEGIFGIFALDSFYYRGLGGGQMRRSGVRRISLGVESLVRFTEGGFQPSLHVFLPSV